MLMNKNDKVDGWFNGRQTAKIPW